MASLAGKYVLLTGGSRGIGPVIAEALAERGAHIALAARSEEGLRNVVKSLSKYEIQTLAVPVDLAQATHQHELISTVLANLVRSIFSSTMRDWRQKVLM